MQLPAFDAWPHRLSGTVIAALLNHRPQLAALGDAVHAAPYKAPPRAPVLAVRPRHMLAGEGDAIEVPGAVEIGAALGIVIGRTACRVAAADAMSHVAGYLVVGELGLPLASHYRPALRQKARDGFCPLGARVIPAHQVADADALALRVLVDGQPLQASTTGDRLRGIAQLIADVSDFITLQPGDVLTLGASHGAPLAAAGQAVTIEIDGVGTLSFTLVEEAA